MSAQLKHEIVTETADLFGADMFGGEGCSMFTSAAAPSAHGDALLGDAVEMFTSGSAPAGTVAATGDAVEGILLITGTPFANPDGTAVWSDCEIELLDHDQTGADNGLFGTDYRMLFPADGTDGIKRFLLDNMAEFARRGLSCPPVVVGVGLGGTKDQAVSLSKEAACLRLIGNRHPDPDVAVLEEELRDLANKTGFGAMGVGGDTTALDVHIEIAYTHTGGMPIAISQFCTAYRRAVARIHADGEVEFREDPLWFTDYYRREGIE